MSDAVELMEFWPVDADENIGFVAADSDFQLWLLDGIGISFDDISYSVIDGPDNSGIYELVLDYEDYTTLNELYASYLGDNEYASEEGQSPIMDPMDFGEPVNWTPLDGTPSLKRRKDAEDEPLFKTQKEMDEHKQWLKESKEKFPKGEVRVVGRDKIDKRSALGKMMSRWDAEGANPSGGATGDQIISWEHNGLSSPSGPPSDIMWAEDFDAHSLHRFTQKDSRPMDIGITRQKIKKEMFSEVSSFMTLKNLAVLTAAGMAGYLIAGRK